MPPKAAAAPKGQANPVSDPNLSFSVVVYKLDGCKSPRNGGTSGAAPSSSAAPVPAPAQAPPPAPPLEGYRLRVFSKWAPCAATSPIFGDPAALRWQQPDGNDGSSPHPKATFCAGSDAKVSEGDSLKQFYDDPMIYFMFTYVKHSGIEVRNFVAVDCSAFLVEASPIKLIRSLDANHEAEIIVKVKAPLLDWDRLLSLQPVCLRLKSLCNYPMHESETLCSASRGAYLYGELEVTPGVKRRILAFPSTQVSASSGLDASRTLASVDSLNQTAMGTALARKNRFDLTVFLLPGLGDLARFRDCISSTNFSVEVFEDDLLARAFPSTFLTEYSALVSGEPGGLQLPNPPASAATAAPAAPAAAGKKGAATGAAAAAAAAIEGPSTVTASSVTAMLPSDSYMHKALWQALQAGRRIRPHGSARFRLEKLLDQASDLLAKFARKQNPSQGEKEHIRVHEDLLVDVRLEKPSHPEKWDLPSDLSLLAALQRAKDNAQASVKSKTEPPKHELFLTSHTSVSMTVELHRRMEEESHQIDSAVLSPVRKLRARGLGDGTTTTATAAAAAAAATATATTPAAGKAMPSSPQRKASAGTFTPLTQPASSASPSSNPPLTAASNSSSSAGQAATLLSPELQRALQETPFTRIVIRMKYSNDELLRVLNAGLERINSRALPNIQGTVRSYSLTPAERQAAATGKLDVISGFMILDDDIRLFVLEGNAGPDGAMENLYVDYLLREQDNDDSLTILCNPEILFPERAYLDYTPDLRRIRVRGKLKRLARKPEVYNRFQVDDVCFQGIDKLLALQRAEDTRSTKVLDMYPSTESLNQLELLYGEAISRADMDGTLRIEFMQSHESRRSRRELQTQLIQASKEREQQQREQERDHADGSSYGSFVFTDCRNPDFEERLRTRPAHRVDYLAEQRKLRRQAWRAMLQRREQRQQVLTQTISQVLSATGSSSIGQGSRPSTRTVGFKESTQGGVGEEEGRRAEEWGEEEMPKIYLYSHQKENFKAKMWEQLRKKVAEDKNATYTFSQDFVSQTVCPVDEEEERKKAAQQSKAGWMTKSGFQYPKPKTRKELLTHPQRPSEARIEDLREPFTDALDVKPSQTLSPELRQRERGFQAQTKEITTFGALQPPQFEHDFQLRLIGHPSQLPRGKLVGGKEPNPDFFRSVHLGGDDQARLLEEALAKEKEEWRKLVVVDTLDFKVGGMKVRDRPIQVDKATDILHDPPKKEALKALRERRSHRGADFGHSVAPLSLLSREPYVENAATNALLRSSDPSKFVTVALRSLGEAPKSPPSPSHVTSSQTFQTGFQSQPPITAKREFFPNTLDFQRYLHPDTGKPALQTLVAKRKHPPLDRSSMECTGPKWDPPKGGDSFK